METSPEQTPSQGVMVVVVGPSGAGKDTLMAEAARQFRDEPRLHFVRRVITRPPDAGGEAHESVDVEEFEARRMRGAFVVDWGAHGLHYGIPADARQRFEAGAVIVVNGSRSALPRFAQHFPRLLVLNIVASPAVLAERLFARGRESREDIDRRLCRSNLDVRGDFDVVTIDNSGALSIAAAKMTAVLHDLLRRR